MPGLNMGAAAPAAGANSGGTMTFFSADRGRESKAKVNSAQMDFLLSVNVPPRPGFRSLTNTHVKQRRPILNGLQREAGKDQANSEYAHALGRHMIRGPFYERRAGAGDHRDHSNRQSGLHPTLSALVRSCAAKALIYPVAA